MSDQASQPNDGRNDFDFFIGRWTGHQRRLRERLKGSTSWEEFESTSTIFKILNGLGNFDEVTMSREAGTFVGITMRLFDPKTCQWSIYWADSVYANLGAPMIGAFKNGRGEFYDREVFDGKTIISRFIWTHPTPDTARWEQAFSPDGGVTWETNWTADFTRIK